MKEGNLSKELIFLKERVRTFNFRAKLIIAPILQMEKHSERFGELFIVPGNSFAAIISLLLR